MSEKKGHWECYDLTRHTAGEWCYKRKSGTCYLYIAPGKLGFGGVEFKEQPGAWYMAVSKFIVADGTMRGMMIIDGGPYGKPATPNRVRFWVED